MKRPQPPKQFSARGDTCPICKRNFRDPDSCPHSIGQAEARLQSDYLHAVVRYELSQAEKKRNKDDNAE